MPEPSFPVFYDPSHRRWPWFVRVLKTVTLLLFLALVTLGASLLARPLMRASRLPRLAPEKDVGNPDPTLTERGRRQLEVKLASDKRRLQLFEQKRRADRADKRRREADFLKRFAAVGGLSGGLASVVEELPANGASSGNNITPAPVPKNALPIVAGFYVNWEETSLASAHRNIANITHLIPEWLHLKPGGQDAASADPGTLPFVDSRDIRDLQDLIPFARQHSVPILPLLNNYTKPKGKEEGEGTWDPDAIHAVISDPGTRVNFITRLRDWLLQNQMQGINIDFEEVAAVDRDNLVQFMKELYAALSPHHLIVTQDVQLDNDNFDIPELARWNDWIIPMFYDEHAGGTHAGPVASIGWTRRSLNSLLKQVPAAKVVLGVGNHAYDWTQGSTQPADITFQSAVVTAKESDDAPIKLDPTSLNPTFTYSEDAVDKNGKTVPEEHVVWLQDATTVFNQLQLAKPRGIRGGALWFMGAEDPSLWKFYSKATWNSDWTQLANLGALNIISYGGQSQVDFEGEGELLQPLAAPSDGKRTVQVDATAGLITSAFYNRDRQGRQLLPSSYVVRRYGGTQHNADKKIILSFDDGPDPLWTPQILDILKRYRVPAVFFVVGKQAEENPTLVRRMYAEGHEIGNHSWSHPDMFRLSPEEQQLQLTATQRIIQAITSHSTTLFRPPYGGDVEPQTARQVGPMEFAARMGYITVGEKNDPNDWRLYELKPGYVEDDSDTVPMDLSRPRTAQEIVASVLANKDVGSIVLLHDAGGNRTMTVLALPQIIEKLRAQGYTFETVAQMRGVSRSQIMPRVTKRDILLAGVNGYIFEFTWIVQVTLTTLFTLSILLGMSRVFLFVGLALIQRQREKKRVYPVGFTPSVSVIIAAYNEEKVINRTIAALLESGYPDLEILVVDDGSKDNTSDVVRSAYGDHPQVQVYRKENGGKASALNRGLVVARGDIMVSLDADTLFARDTVWKLARHFADPKVGAVSGNVRVGNPNNIFTKWQSIEYTTSQNFDRRGYDLLNCITVVPGAVGAMRREAVIAVGGYTHDTLAEDTDLTWKLRRAGWRITNDNSAMAYTEAPETLGNLAKQRFRWAYGTLQCLWKHRGALGTQGAFGWIALPSLWLYQILFPAVSPFMDVAMVYSLFAGNFLKFGQFFLLMFGVEFVAAFIAFRMDKGNLRLLPWLFFQRFVYRQLMYYVVLKSLVAAARGAAVGWNKFERTGTAQIESKAA